jgi:biopolymer transport protein ExbD
MRRFRKTENLDTELNLVPIIDCFVMLICFLLFTAAFTQLVYIETKITQNTAAAMTQSRNELDKFHLTVTLKDNGYELKVAGTEAKQTTITVPKSGEDYDYQKLHAHLIELKTKHPDRFSIDLAVNAGNQNAIKYDFVMKTIDSVRHLTDQEFSQLKVATKKAQNIELSSGEESVKPEPALEMLAESVRSNKVASNADTKALFPDIALTGVY